jgi:hypothetical protein
VPAVEVPSCRTEPVHDALGFRSRRLIARNTRIDGYVLNRTDIETKGVRLIAQGEMTPSPDDARDEVEAHSTRSGPRACIKNPNAMLFY